ncbi:glycoside hydrolase family 19 protein [Rhodococcus jostii]|uniref:glycoside hydrolase family 19 protein n=1 Tax=Rhodococcus jostii TaxID=132919 RepID=UPI0036409D06
MDSQTLAQAMGNRPGVDYAALTGPCNQAMIVAEVTTFARAVLWCAQIGHESGGLRWMEEIADGSAYEGRTDLGNTQPGDGRRYKGRGPIQLTGRDNYRRFSVWAHQRGLVNSPTYFEDDPLEVSVPRWGFMAAAFFWSTHNINRFADGREVTNATRVINGGTHGLQDRIDRYNQCFPLGDALLPAHDDDQEFDMAGEAQDVQQQLRGPELAGWPARRYHETDQNRSRFSLVDYAREIDAKTNSKLNLEDRPVDPAVKDDLFGHVLSLRAEVLALTALVKKMGGTR